MNDLYSTNLGNKSRKTSPLETELETAEQGQALSVKVMRTTYFRSFPFSLIHNIRQNDRFRGW